MRPETQLYPSSQKCRNVVAWRGPTLMHWPSEHVSSLSRQSVFISHGLHCPSLVAHTWPPLLSHTTGSHAPQSAAAVGACRAGAATICFHSPILGAPSFVRVTHAIAAHPALIRTIGRARFRHVSRPSRTRSCDCRSPQAVRLCNPRGTFPRSLPPRTYRRRSGSRRSSWMHPRLSCTNHHRSTTCWCRRYPTHSRWSASRSQTQSRLRSSCQYMRSPKYRRCYSRPGTAQYTVRPPKRTHHRAVSAITIIRTFRRIVFPPLLTPLPQLIPDANIPMGSATPASGRLREAVLVGPQSTDRLRVATSLHRVCMAVLGTTPTLLERRTPRGDGQIRRRRQVATP